ncbi:MAG: thermonuclease family protein [Ahrensia sp.]|nr:thermonuclease family protein [Ahrensia sp.]
MRSVLVGIGLVIFAVMALPFVLPIIMPQAYEASKQSVDATLSEQAIQQADVFPQEPIKTDARRVDAEEADDAQTAVTAPLERGTAEQPQTIARLPAKPQLPVTPGSSETSKRVETALSRPLIEQPGLLQSNALQVSLSGTVSPTLDFKCETDRVTHPCGRQARTALRRFIRGRTAQCDLSKDAQKGAHETRCTVAGKDIANWLVQQGWALAAVGSDYEEAMADARKAGRGLWRDGFDAQAIIDLKDKPQTQ